MYDWSGTFNLAMEMWGTATQHVGGKPKKNDVVSEVMWYLHWQEGANPAGAPFAEVELDGITWEVWMQSRSEDISWSFYTFKPPVPICEGEDGKLRCKYKLDVAKYLHYLVDEGVVDKGEFFEGIELGNEVMGDCEDSNGGFSKGLTLLKKFDVAVV